MDEVEMISSNKDSVDVTSEKPGLGEVYNCGDELWRSAFKHFDHAMDLLQRSEVGCARETLQNGCRYLLALTPYSFPNPTDYEKQQVRRGKEMFLKRVSGPPGVILLDQLDSDQDDLFYIDFTIAFGALAFKLQEYIMAIKVFKLAIKSNCTDSQPHREKAVDSELSEVVAKANIGCVYLNLGQLEKAKENIECALKNLERFKLEKNIVTLDADIFAVKNNLSLVLQGQQNYSAAIKLQIDLVSRAKHLRLPFREVATMHYNRAELFLELEDPFKALKELQELKSLSDIMDDENGIPEEFISSKMGLVYLLMKEVARAKEIAEKLALSPSLLPWQPSSSSLSLSSFSSSSLSISPSSSSSSSSSTSSSSSSSSSASSSLSSSPSSSPPLSSSSSSSFEFEELRKSNGKIRWDFKVATVANLLDFHLYQENVQPVSMILDLCASKWKEMFGKSHPICASLLYRQGVTFSLKGENESSKNCFEEALSIYTRAGFASIHSEVSKCNAALARLLLCESFQDESFLKSQSITRPPSDRDARCKTSQEFIFSDSISSSFLFEKFVKQIIQSEDKFGKISELVKTKNLLKVQGPSVGQITLWLHDRSIKLNTQPTHAKMSLVANYEESLPCSRADINVVLVEEMKMCASTLGVPFETCAEKSSWLSPLQIPGVMLMNPTQTPNHGDQNAFDDGESGASATFSARDMATKFAENPNASLLPRTMRDQKFTSGEKFSFPSHDQKNENEISTAIAPSSPFSKANEDKAKEDSSVLPIEVFPQYDAILTTDANRDTEEPYTKAKIKRNAASDQSRNESRCSPLTLKAGKGQNPTQNTTQQVIGTQEDYLVKPCVLDDKQEHFADGVVTFQVSSPEGITVERDHNAEQERKLHISNQESRGNGKVVKTERSPKQGGVKGIRISKNRKERGSLAHSKENDASNSSCRGEDVVADNSDANHADEVRGACGYQNKRYPQDDERKVANERGSKKMPKEGLGLKGGRRDEYSSSHSSLYSSCISESSHFGIKSGFLARHSDDSMSCSMDETEGRHNCSYFSQFPNSYPPEPSFSLPHNSTYRSPNNEEILSLPPPPPAPQFPSLPYDVPQKRHGRSALSVHSASTKTNFISEQTETSLASEKALSLQERERIKREIATATTTTQPGLPNSNSGTTSDDESLAALERRVAEACSLVERVLKEREEKVGAIKERERRQKEERARREPHEQERKERVAKKTMQRNETGEGTSTGSEEGAPSERAALPENPQWLCEHYQRLCRVKFPCCERFYPCHRCHNNSDECEIDNCKAKEAFYIECSVCRHQQPIDRDAQTCARCNTKMSAYFCSICKHFTGKDKHPYHCTKCGICRIHKDRSFHCDVCNVCLDKRLQGKHTCRPDSGHDECCICLEDAFSGCQILPCSHKVHRECAIAMIQNGVRNCPICRHPLYSQSAGTE